jgi:CubicO group peptidase (beta-lactamase class C family)
VIPALLLAAVTLAPQDSVDRWAPLARYLEERIAAHAFPGAVVAIGRRDTVLYLHAFGHLTYGAASPGARVRGRAADRDLVTTRTVYDLASLTKVVGLTTAIMMLVEEGRVDLSAPVRGYVQMFGYTHDSTITVRHLLTHSSGLPAWKPYWQRSHDRSEIFDLAAHEPVEYPTGTRTVYSDIGAINLTNMVETLTGERLDRYLQRLLFGPLGMRDTRYRPPRSWRPRIAPTEMDTTYRHRLVRGEVHDENSAAMGGISGHAGLFGTAPDLVRFAQMILRGGTFPSSRASSRALVLGAHGPGFSGAASERDLEIGFVRAETIAAFTRRQDSAFSSRALGWDTPDGQNSAGTRLSAHAFGHTGFTGTSLWMDPEQDLFVILLTNRVHPTRDNTLVFEVRRWVADFAVDAAGGRR